jgi:hypothetical protein
VGFRVARNDGAAFGAPADVTLLALLRLTAPEGVDLLRRHP